MIVGGRTYSENRRVLGTDNIYTQRQQQYKRLFEQIVDKSEHYLQYFHFIPIRSRAYTSPQAEIAKLTILASY